MSLPKTTLRSAAGPGTGRLRSLLTSSGLGLLLIVSTAPAALASPAPEPGDRKWSNSGGSGGGKSAVSRSSGGSRSSGSSGSRSSSVGRSGSSSGSRGTVSRGAPRSGRSGTKYGRPTFRRPTSGSGASTSRPAVQRGPSTAVLPPSGSEGRKWHPNNSGKNFDLRRPGPHRHGYGYYHGYGYHPFYYHRYPYRSIYFGYPYYYPYGAYYSWGYPWGYYDYRRRHSGYGYADYDRGGYYSGDRGVGALDINIKPRKAEVYVNGQPVGNAGQYDGFPSHLWLEEGTYNLVFYEEGYETLARRVNVLPGLTIDVDGDMVEGNATAPEDLLPELMQPPAEEVARLEQEEGRRAAREEAWRQRAREHKARKAKGGAAGAANGALDLREAPGRVYLTVEPAEASVYLDGRFLGTGEEVSRLRSGLLVDSGTHDLQVVHPDFETQERSLEVPSGEDITVELDLSSADAA